MRRIDDVPIGAGRLAVSAALALALVPALGVAQETAGPGAEAEVPAREVEERTANDGNVILSGVPEVPPEISERLRPYQNTRSAGFAAWREDGEGIYIRTRFADVTQLHRVDVPGGARHQLTFEDEPVGGAEGRPGREEVLFSMDEGGGEFYQLFVLEPGSGAARRLTDGGSRNGAATWSRDGERLAFTSTRRNGRSNDIWVVAADDTASARVALEAPDGTYWAAVDWDATGERLLIGNYVSITDSRIHLLDLRTGEARRLAGGETGVHQPVAFGPDGNGIFLVTDRDSEFRRLAYMPLPEGPIEVLTEDIEWDVEGVVFSRDRRRAAFSVNEGGISRLYLLDPATRRHRRVEDVPVGILSGGGFSPDGGRLAFTLNTPSTPSDVFTLALGEDPLSHGEIERWTYSEVGGLDAETFVTPELIEYPTFDGRRIPAFLYTPPGPGPHPVIIRIHGGPESQTRPGFSSVFQSWISVLGAAVLDPNVRGSAGYGRTYVSLDDGMRREDSVRDIGALLDWIAARPELDEDRVVVYGGSYGGYMVLASLMHFGDRLRGGVDVVGISDFISFLENTESYRRDLRRPEYGDERDPEMRAFFERISPLRNADRITAPLFVIQGENDPRVPVTESEQIVRQVRANGHPVWYMKALNEGHGFARRENQDLMRDLVVLFLQRRLAADGGT